MEYQWTRINFLEEILVKIPISLFLMAQILGCGGRDRNIENNLPIVIKSQNGPSKPTTNPVVENPSVKEDAFWSAKQYRSKFFEATVRSLSEEGQKLEERAFLNTNSERIFIPELKYSLLHLIGFKGFNDSVYIVPKIFALSSLLEGRIWLTETSGEKGIASFYIALIDGLRSKIATGYGSFDVPNDFPKISSSEDYQKTLGFKPHFLSTRDCPSQVELKDGESKLSLRLHVTEGGCPRNQFIQVSAQADLSVLRDWFENRIPNGNVTLDADFRSKASFSIQQVSLRFLTAPIYEALRLDFSENIANRKDGGGVRVQDVHERISRLLNEFFGETEFVGLSDLERNEVIDAFIFHFYEVSGNQCAQNEESCLRLKSALDSLDPIQFEFVREKFFEIPLSHTHESTSIVDLGRNVQPFKVLPENTDDTFPPKNGRVGGLVKQVAPGDLIELEIEKVQSLKRELNPQGVFVPERSKLENPVCTSYGAVPVKDEVDYGTCIDWNQSCAETKKGCNREASRCNQWKRTCTISVSRGMERTVTRYYSDPNSVGSDDGHCGGATCSRSETYCAEPFEKCVRYVNTSCKTYGTKRVPAGPAPCVNQENQWVKTYDLSHIVSNKTVDETLESIDQKAILSGVQVRFSGVTWNITSESFESTQVSCPLMSFFPEMTKKGKTLIIRFRVQNQESNGCQPFHNDNSRLGFYPEIALVNQLSSPQKIPCGFREDFWNHTSTYHCPKSGQKGTQPLFETYFPRMEIQGRLRLPGLKLTSKNGG